MTSTDSEPDSDTVPDSVTDTAPDSATDTAPDSVTDSAPDSAPRLPPRAGRSRGWVLLAARASFFLGGALPWLLPYARQRLPLGPVGALLDAAFFLMCHRRPARTLVLDGMPMPLCSRCAGIALGLALGALIAWPSPSLRATRIAAVVAGALMIADIVTQDLGIHPVWHATRLATGGLLGYVLAIGLFAVIRRERAKQP